MRKREKGQGTREKGKALAFTAGAFVLCGFTLCLHGHDRITTKVTWDREIAPIFEARCVNCHQPGGKSTIPLATYQQARPWAVAIKEEVLTRRMPKWNAARGYGAFANDPSLAPFEIALVAAWVDGGAPENEKNKALPQTFIVKPAIFTAPAPSSVRTISTSCEEQRANGTLLAIRPALDRNGSAGIAVVRPNGHQEIVAWIRGYDPDNATTYWLRNPVVLSRGSRIHVDASGTCAMQLFFARK